MKLGDAKGIGPALVRTDAHKFWAHCIVLAVVTYVLVYHPLSRISRDVDAMYRSYSSRAPPRNESDILRTAREQCRLAHAPAGAPPHFHERTQNDRYVHGTRSTVVRNATVFDGQVVLFETDVFAKDGLIVWVESAQAHKPAPDAHEVQAHGQWLTPGIVDMHTHLGVYGMPILPTHTDLNSRLGPVRPMVRSVDGFNEHDMALRTTLAGGITSALVLPGSLDNIGGHAVLVKLGALAGRSPSSRVIDPPRAMVMPGEANHGRDALYSPASGMHRDDGSTSFRQVKMACGENAFKYDLVRPDEAWNFRSAFERARQVRESQDDFCAKVKSGMLDDAPPDALHFPTNLEVDVLVDVLRGRTKVHTHCYSMNDLDAFVRHANEFNFSIAAFHHAHETYLVSSTLHAAPHTTPAVALFSTNAFYKYESYFGTPFLAKLLASHNITPIFKSDHPVTDSRRLVNQAAEAHHFGLDAIEALRGVTSYPARTMGLEHRIGHIAQGWDADFVLWDRHPLQLGATPVAVYVDGASQFDEVHASGPDVQGDKPLHAPRAGNYTQELTRVSSALDAIAHGLERAFPEPVAHVSSAILTNVSRVYERANGTIQARDLRDGSLAYINGRVACIGSYEECKVHIDSATRRVDVCGGVVMPGMTAYGGALGLSNIPSEPSTSNGEDIPLLTRHGRFNADRSVPYSADGLWFGSHAMHRAHASGITTGVNPPAVSGMFGGISAHFDTGARTVLDHGSVRAQGVAMHIDVHADQDGMSVAAQIAALRAVLQEPPNTPEWGRVARGEWPLVIKTDSHETAAKIVLLQRAFPHIRMVLDSAGALRHVAAQLAEANISVIMPPKVWAYQWEQLGRLPGPPLSADTELGVLLRHGVRVALRVEEAWEAANLLWMATWAAQEAHITDAAQVLTLITTK